MIRYADHSARGVAPLAKLAWRPRERPSRGFEPFVTRRNALESRADRGMRAYVTSGGPLMTTRKPAPCVRATASRHVGWRAQGSRHTSGVKAFAYAPHDGGAHGVGLSGMAGDACVSLQVSPPTVATQVSGGRDGPRRIDGDARTKHRVRARTPRRSHHPEVAPDVSILRRAQNRYVASDALASMTEATRQHRSVSRRTRRSR